MILLIVSQSCLKFQFLRIAMHSVDNMRQIQGMFLTTGLTREL